MTLFRAHNCHQFREFFSCLFYAKISSLQVVVFISYYGYKESLYFLSEMICLFFMEII